jgi:hypothetical protein
MNDVYAFLSGTTHLQPSFLTLHLHLKAVQPIITRTLSHGLFGTTICTQPQAAEHLKIFVMTEKNIIYQINRYDHMEQMAKHRLKNSLHVLSKEKKNRKRKTHENMQRPEGSKFEA